MSLFPPIILSNQDLSRAKISLACRSVKLQAASSSMSFVSVVIALALTVCVLPQLAISEHFTVNLHKSLIGALSFNFARHRQLRQHAVIGRFYFLYNNEF